MRKLNQNNNEYGRELEQYVSNKLIEIGFSKARPSKGSGNKGEAGDIGGQDIFVGECKHYNTENITIKSKIWSKLNNEIPLHSKRFPVYFLQNENNLKLAVIDIDQFFIILSKYLEGEKNG